MRLTPPTKYVFFSSVVLGLAALAIYFLGVFGVVEDTFHFAFWGRCQSKILNTWSGHGTAQIDPQKFRKINGREIRF